MRFVELASSMWRQNAAAMEPQIRRDRRIQMLNGIEMEH